MPFSLSFHRRSSRAHVSLVTPLASRFLLPTSWPFAYTLQGIARTSGSREGSGLGQIDVMSSINLGAELPGRTPTHHHCFFLLGFLFPLFSLSLSLLLFLFSIHKLRKFVFKPSTRVQVLLANFNFIYTIFFRSLGKFSLCNEGEKGFQLQAQNTAVWFMIF